MIHPTNRPGNQKPATIRSVPTDREWEQGMACANKQQCIIAFHVYYTLQFHQWGIELAEEAQQSTGKKCKSFRLRKQKEQKIIQKKKRECAFRY